MASGGASNSATTTPRAQSLRPRRGGAPEVGRWAGASSPKDSIAGIAGIAGIVGVVGIIGIIGIAAAGSGEGGATEAASCMRYAASASACAPIVTARGLFGGAAAGGAVVAALGGRSSRAEAGLCDRLAALRTLDTTPPITTSTQRIEPKSRQCTRYFCGGAGGALFWSPVDPPIEPRISVSA